MRVSASVISFLISSVKWPEELSSLFGVTPRAISKWMLEWVNKGILIPNSGSTRITSYRLSIKYSSLKVSDIGFTD